MPSISTSTVLPGFIEPTPTEVPHRITSPGNSVMSAEIRLTSRATEKAHVADRVVLAQLAVERAS